MQDTGKEKKSCFGCSVIAVCGWLVCAAMCLWLTISLGGAVQQYLRLYLHQLPLRGGRAPSPARRDPCLLR